ncbi:hypothetical protein [Terribacillus sp. DMT04]|uniref:hypothetical protein n=1 Tax=Terribacillus TaxID=459532 RepID=UPI001C2BDF4A|nr:hypothetical protein [Terribacillus sp. DMT04]QXE03612.1 hypothetical protein KS242_17670 [Terribacillus sp. DMT04]
MSTIKKFEPKKLYSAAVTPEEAKNKKDDKNVGVLVYSKKAEYIHPLDRLKRA